MDLKRIRKVKVADLTVDPQNVNCHSEESIAALMRSLKTYGQFRTIEVTKSGIVTKGNGTVLAAMRLGLPTLVAYVTELDGAVLKASNIADNAVAKLSHFDEDALAKMLREIQVASEKMAAETKEVSASTDSLLASIGFSDGEMARLLALNNVAPVGGGKPKADDDKPKTAEVKYSVVVPCSSKDSQDSVYNAIIAQGFEARKVST